jgi:hypothetical protein
VVGSWSLQPPALKRKSTVPHKDASEVHTGASQVAIRWWWTWGVATVTAYRIHIKRRGIELEAWRWDAIIPSSIGVLGQFFEYRRRLGIKGSARIDKTRPRSIVATSQIHPHSCPLPLVQFRAAFSVRCFYFCSYLVFLTSAQVGSAR